MRDNRILVDTSCWISYFRGKDRVLGEKMDQLLDISEIYIPRVVIAELIQGAKSDREISFIRGYFDAFIIIGENEHTWLKAGELSYRLKRKGATIHIIDCYIAMLAYENSCKILTLDRHFKRITRELKIRLLL